MFIEKKQSKAIKRSHVESSSITSAAAPPPKQRMVVTPWRDTAEFSIVYDWLFLPHTTSSNRRKALSHLRIWNLRRGNLCPASVLATGVLVKAQLEDKQGSSNIQTTYASAFTRFFNFMSSIMQSFNISSMYETARQLGLQSFIVDLRHLCSHGQELPPVEVLRNTAQHCLDWLRTFYWLPQRESMTNLDAPNLQRKEKLEFENELKALLIMYDLALECQLKSAKNLKEIKKLKNSNEFNKLRIYCSKKQIKTSKEILDAVIKDVGAVVKRYSSSIKDLGNLYVNNILKMKYFLSAGINHDKQIDLLVQSTQGLFQLLAVQDFVEKIFVAFVHLAENKNVDNESRSGACFWATKIINTLGMLKRMKRMYQEELDINPQFKKVDFSMLNKAVISKNLRKLMIHSGVDLPLTLIFGDCPKTSRSWVIEQEFIFNRLISLNLHSIPILKSLLPLVEPPLYAEKFKSLTKLCDTKVEYLMKEKSKESENMALNGIAAEKTKFGIWTLDKENNWAKCALGVLPCDEYNGNEG